MKNKSTVGKIFTVWAVYAGSDNGYGPKIGTFSSVANANNAAIGKGWYGGHDGDVVEQKAIMADDGEIVIVSERSVDLDGAYPKLETKIPESRQRRWLF